MIYGLIAQASRGGTDNSTIFWIVLILVVGVGVILGNRRKRAENAIKNGGKKTETLTPKPDKPSADQPMADISKPRQENKRNKDPKVFISYRRSDSADVTGRIYDRLAGHFNREDIFKDVDSIPLGVNFKDHLSNAVSSCDLMLAIIGQQWLSHEKEEGVRALDLSNDYVRIEIAAALEREIPIIPILVGGAQIPAESKLPDDLKDLVYRNGVPVRPDPDFHKDMDRLIAGIEESVARLKP